MRNKETYNEETKKPKNKFFKLFDMNRDGKGVYEFEDRTPNLKFFFKLYFRKFSKILQLNLLMLFQVMPIVAIILMIFMGNKVPSPKDVSYAPLFGINLISSSIASSMPLDIASTQMGIPFLSTAMTLAIVAIGLLLVITWGWQNVGAAYVARGLFRGDPVFTFSDFFYGIKRNFKQGFFLGLFDAVVVTVLAVDFLYLINITSGFLNDFLFFSIIAISFIYFVMRFYIYLLLITFDIKFIKLLKNALIFTILGIKRNLLAILGIIILSAINIAVIILTLPTGLSSIFIVLPFVYLFGTLLFITTYACYPVIDKYMIAPYADENPQNTDDEIIEE